jgi:ABC-type antimicrobial peptide transport system permease subunit
MYYLYSTDPASRDNVVTLASLLDPASMMLFVRAAGDPTTLARPIQAIIASMDRDVPVAQIATMDAVMATQFTSPRFYLVLLSAFAAVAVLLAAVGVYSVISHAASARTREMGVRLALGASAREPFRLVAGEGMRLAAIGGGIGFVAALALTRYLRALLFGVGPTDPVTFAVAMVVLCLAAGAACWIPARRASRVDPVIALRAD